MHLIISHQPSPVTQEPTILVNTDQIITSCTQLYGSSFFPRTVLLWNILPVSVLTAPICRGVPGRSCSQFVTNCWAFYLHLRQMSCTVDLRVSSSLVSSHQCTLSCQHSVEHILSLLLGHQPHLDITSKLVDPVESTNVNINIHVESSGYKHGGKWSLLWQNRQNSSEISMDRLIKLDEKTLVSNIIHVSYIRS